MKLEHLYYFQEAVKYRSISVAAKQNYISQSSFSGAISRLERELGAPLFTRTNTGVEPTAFGLLALEKASVIFQAQSDLVKAAQERSLEGNVRIQCVSGFHHRVLTETVRTLLDTRPGVVLSVSTGESRQIASAVSSGLVAFGVVVKGKFLHVFRDLTYEPLFRDEYLLFAGEASPLWEKKNVTWEELRAQAHLGFLDEFRQDNGGIMEIFREGTPPRVSYWTDDLDSMKKLIAETDRVALFARSMSRGDPWIETGAIRSIPIIGRDTSFEIGVLTSAKYHLSPLDREVLEVLRDTVEDLEL